MGTAIDRSSYDTDYYKRGQVIPGLRVRAQRAPVAFCACSRRPRLARLLPFLVSPLHAIHPSRAADAEAQRQSRYASSCLGGRLSVAWSRMARTLRLMG